MADVMACYGTPFDFISFIGFWITFQVTLCSHYFYNFRKKGPRPKWTTYKHVSDKSKKCLSGGKFVINDH